MSARALNALAAGRAPSCWKRETERDLARLAALPRACAWVGETAAVKVKLCAEPPFGSCLSSLAGREARGNLAHTRAAGTPPRPRASEPSSRAPVCDGTDLDGPRRRLARLSRADGEARPTPAQLPEQADRSLLQRLACETPRAADPEPPGRRARTRAGDALAPAQPARASRRATQMSEADERGQPPTPEARRPPRRTRQSPVPSDTRRPPPSSVTRRDWQDELVGRAERVLARAGLPPAEPAARGGRRLHEAWASAVAGGTAAPLELLRRLASTTRTGSLSGGGESAPAPSSERGQGAPGRATDLAPASRRATGDAADVSEASDDSAGAIRAGTGADGFPRDGRGRARRAAADGPAEFGWPSAIDEAGDEPAYDSAQTRGRRASPDARAHASDDYLGSLPGGNLYARDESADASEVWARQLAPPALATHLPPLIPPPRVGMPAAAVASAKARQGAHDEATADEDLEVLAAKIERILDEDARRHGIDV